jgi:two-component system CheB/CheR fusion protein
MAADAHKANAGQAERLHRFAHDIRNRLTGIREVLRHLEQPTPDGNTAELTLFAEQQFFKALREVESLLDDMQVERGIGPLQREPLDPATLIARAVANMEHRFAKKEQKVVTDLAQGIRVNGDAACLTELITALLSNASKFSPRGSTIQVHLVASGPMASLRVTDDGVGMSTTDLEQVFVRYAWLSSRSTDGEAQGRGTLGRAVQWARAHGGTLRAESAGSGAGSTFVLELPIG